MMNNEPSLGKKEEKTQVKLENPPGIFTTPTPMSTPSKFMQGISCFCCVCSYRRLETFFVGAFLVIFSGFDCFADSQQSPSSGNPVPPTPTNPSRTPSRGEIGLGRKFRTLREVAPFFLALSRLLPFFSSLTCSFRVIATEAVPVQDLGHKEEI
jgi:hypothetical protein